MGRLNFKTNVKTNVKTWMSAFIACAVVGVFSSSANAASFNNKMAVQGYLKSGSTGLNGTYDMQIIIRKNGAAIWYKGYTGVSVANGVFSKVLSGNDDNGTPVPMAPDIFVHTANTDNFTVDVKVDVDQNGIGVGSDATFTGIDLVPVPLSLYSNRATTIDQGGASTGQYLMWNGTAWAPTTLAVTNTQINSGAVGSSQLAASAVDLSTSTVTGTLPISKGGTGLTTTPTNGKLLIGNGTGYVSANITAGTGVTVTNSAGGITIDATGTGGTVTGVASANSDIGVATGTTTPVLTLNSGTTGGAGDANKIAKFDAGGLLTAAMIPNLDTAKITTGTLSVARGGTGVGTIGAGNIVIGNGISAVNSLAGSSTGNVVYATGASTWASGSPDTAGLMDKTSTQSISGAKTFGNTVKMSNQNLFTLGDTGANGVSMIAPATVTANYTLTWPAAVAGSAGQVLTSNTSGVLSWTTPSTFSVSSVSGAAPITISGTASVPIVNVSAATTGASGVVTLASNGGTTASTVVQATDSRLGDSRAPNGAAGGDLSSTYPNPVVAKIQGTAVSATVPTTAGQVLRYDGASSWIPQFISMFDLRSTVTGASAFGGVGCTSGQTLTWTAATDNLSCSNIVVGASNFSSQSANTVLVAPNGAPGTPTFRTLVAADIPSGTDATKLPLAGGTMSGAIAMGGNNITGGGTITGTAITGTSHVVKGAGAGTATFSYPNTATSTTLIFPNAAGSNGNALTTDGAGNLSWTTPSASDATKLPLAGGTMSGAIAMGGQNITGGGAITGTTLTSTVATGTAPFTVASTTNVANLNASSLSGATFAAPGAIGGTTPSTGAFTTLTSNSTTTLGGSGITTKINDTPVAATTTQIGDTPGNSGTSTVTIASGATGTGIAAVTIGSTLNASSLSLNAGTGNMSLNSATGSISLNNSATSAGTVNIANTGTTINSTVNIGNAGGTTGVSTIGMGNVTAVGATAGPTLTIGSITSAGGSTGTTTTNIANDNSTSSALTALAMGSVTGAANSGIHTISLGVVSAGTGANTIDIGKVSAAAASKQAITLGNNTNTSTGLTTVQIGNVSGAANSGVNTIQMGVISNGTGANTIDIGKITSAAVSLETVTVGNNAGTSTGATTVQMGNSTNSSTGTSTTTVGGVASGAGTGTNTLNLGVNNGTGNSTNTIHIGDGTNATATGTAITIGNTTSAGSTVKILGGTALARPLITCNFASTSATSTAGACASVTAAHKCACSLNVANTTATVYPIVFVPGAGTVTVTWSATTGGTAGNTSCICY